jgi:hypothetical protein
MFLFLFSVDVVEVAGKVGFWCLLTQVLMYRYRVHTPAGRAAAIGRYLLQFVKSLTCRHDGLKGRQRQRHDGHTREAQSARK